MIDLKAISLLFLKLSDAYPKARPLFFIASVKDLRVVPPSLKKDAGYIKKASDYGLF